MNFIILGDKYQKGMKSKGCQALLKLNSSTHIIDYQYAHIKKYFPDSKIIYISGFEHKKLHAFLSVKYKDIIVVHNQHFENYNNLYSLSLAINFFIGETFILNGSCVIHKKILSQLDNNLGTQVFVNTNNQSSLGCIIDSGVITNIGFDLPNPLDEIYYISDQDMDSLKAIVNNPKCRNYFVFEALNLLIDNNTTIKPYFYNQKIKRPNVYIK